MASPEYRQSADLFGLLFSLIRFYAEINDLGGVYGPRVAFRLGERGGTEVGWLGPFRDHPAFGGNRDKGFQHYGKKA